jgi:hypothetical protein
MTVNMGDELLTVSTNEIAACFNAIRPKTIENNLFVRAIKNIKPS